MKFSKKLENASEIEITQLFSEFIELCVAYIRQVEYGESLKLGFSKPQIPNKLTGESLAEYIIAMREYDLAVADLDRRLSAHVANKKKAHDALCVDPLILNHWVTVDDQYQILIEDTHTDTPFVKVSKNSNSFPARFQKAG